jgi:hypothetical protein
VFPAYFRKAERHFRSVARCLLEQPLHQLVCPTAAAVRGFGEDRTDTAKAYGPLIQNSCEVVLNGAGEHLATVHQGNSSLMVAPPDSLHLGGVKSAECLPTQAFVPGAVGRLENAVENDPFGGNNRRHMVIIVAPKGTGVLRGRVERQLQSLDDLNQGPHKQCHGRAHYKDDQRKQPDEQH